MHLKIKLHTGAFTLVTILFFYLGVFFSATPVMATAMPPNGLTECRWEGKNINLTTYEADLTRPIKADSLPACQSVDTGALGFQIPSLGDILTFAIRAFFAIAGIAALFYLLLGAFAWVTSGGDKDAITAAREKITAAIVGMILIVAVLAIIWTLEQVIFKRRICLGLSCPVTLPGLIETTNGKNCCLCLKPDDTPGDQINTFSRRCREDGSSVPL